MLWLVNLSVIVEVIANFSHIIEYLDRNIYHRICGFSPENFPFPTTEVICTSEGMERGLQKMEIVGVGGLI